MTIGIIGLGLIGGSIARDVRQAAFAERLIGVDLNPMHGQQALALGLVDDVQPLDVALPQAQLWIVATPVSAMKQLLPNLLDGLQDGQVVLEVGSTKAEILRTVATHPRRAQLVATHPMAGTEHAGPAAALTGLFRGKSCVLVDVMASAPRAVALAESLYRDALGMRLTYLDADAHDVHTAYVSHISHLSSFALALTVLAKERDEQQIFELASGGFRSTVRLAKSTAEMWVPIFEQNRDNILDVLDEHINTLALFRSLFIKQRFREIGELIERANDIQRILS